MLSLTFNVVSDMFMIVVCTSIRCQRTQLNTNTKRDTVIEQPHFRIDERIISVFVSYKFIVKISKPSRMGCSNPVCS